MPYANYQDKLAAMRAYSRTSVGKAAKARSHRRYVQKRRDLASKSDMSVNLAPLATAMKTWRT